ncbi:MAG: phosphoenolpyruvate synthase [Dehalococcoidia bacterium]
MAKDKAIVWFEEVGREDIALVGGKGANLGEMTRVGIPVPPGFIVTAQSYFRFLEQSDLRPQIESLLSALDHRDSAALQKVSDEIKETIVAASVPADLAEQIREAYRRLGGSVAVRSSATAEDLPEASFAGQQATFLNVSGEENVVEAVKACWASLFEARAIFYRVEGGFEHMKVGIAVPVQRMVQSETSGVAFTVEPVSSDLSKIVLEAVRGLGEAIVSGAVTPDHYLLDKETLEILEREVAVQKRELVYKADGRDPLHPNEWREVPADIGSRQKLSDAEITALAEIVRRVEQHYRFPQDIEWAQENGKFYLVQTRPVTTLKAEERPVEELHETAPVLLSGSPASPGVELGPVRIVVDASHLDEVKQGDVLVADMTTPDFVPAMKRAVAIVTDRGGRTCHAAIVSRELGVPCVVGTSEATRTLKPDQFITVDGYQGKVYDGRAEASLAWAEREKARRAAASKVKTRTNIYVNLAAPELAEVVAKRNVDGVGLLRAEFIVAQIGEHPRHAIDQGRGKEFTRKLADGLLTFARAFHPRPVVYRTTDFKTNEYRDLTGGEKYEDAEENPMIGYRGASRYIRDREVFRLEVEAIKIVHQEYKNLWVMIPFVRTPEEMAGVKELMAEFGLPQSEDFKLWMMAEVPSNALLLDKFIDVGIDGISIGSNDLTQLVLGLDRDNEKFGEEFDERNAAVMVALERLVKGGIGRGITVSICGQAPSDYPELTEKLVEWGITSVSVSPDAIDITRELVAKAEAKLGVKAA